MATSFCSKPQVEFQTKEYMFQDDIFLRCAGFSNKTQDQRQQHSKPKEAGIQDKVQFSNKQSFHQRYVFPKSFPGFQVFLSLQTFPENADSKST